MLGVCVGSSASPASSDLTLGVSSVACLSRWLLCQNVLGAARAIVYVLWIPAYSGHHCHLVFDVSFVKLFITCMGYDIYREVFDEFSEVAPNICHCDIQRFLQFHKPVSIRDLISWEEVLMLGHLRKWVRVDRVLIWKTSWNIWFHHKTVMLMAVHLRAVIWIDWVLLLRGVVETDIKTWMATACVWIRSMGHLALLLIVWDTAMSSSIAYRWSLSRGYWRGRDRFNLTKRVQILVLPLIYAHIQLFPFAL